MLGIVVPRIKEHVSQACAHYRSYDDIDQQDAQPAFGSAFALEHLLYDLIAEHEADYEHHAVPADG